MTADERLAALNIELPPAPKPGGVYKPIVRVDRLLYVSGHGPLRSDKTLITGKVGADLSLEEGYAAARQVGLTMLATILRELGTLNGIKRAIKTLGMVNAAPDFTQHPQVINGFSELMGEVFGDDGIGARSAVGMGSLPGDISVEVEIIFEMHPDA